MPERVNSRARGYDEVEVGDGVLARLADHAFENPAMTGGLVVMAMTAAAIVSNAMFLQNGRHPGPLFSTRAAISAPAKPVPVPRIRAEPPLPAPAPPAPAQAAPVAVDPAQALLVQIQGALAQAGYYKYAVDGIAGSRTRAAIAAYQKHAGLKPTGEPSQALLGRLMKPAAVVPVVTAAPPVPAAAPSPVVAAAPVKPAPVAAVPVPPAPIPAAPLTKVAAAPVQAAPAPVAAAPVAPVTKVAAVAAPDAADAAAERRIKSVETALNQAGYGPVVADGEFTPETENAIRRFELDNGMPVTGKLDDELVLRLISIGAMKPL